MLQRYHSYKNTMLTNLGEQGSAISSRGTEYVCKGEGVPLLISHGSFGGFDQGLLSLYFMLESHIRMIAPSRFGYLSTPLIPNPTPKMQASAYIELMDELEINKTHIVGISGGGMSALEFALLYPDRCSGLIMLSAVSSASVPPPPMNLLVKHVLSNDLIGWLLTTKLPHLIGNSTGDDYRLVQSNPELESTVLKLAWPPIASKRKTGMLNDLYQASKFRNFPFEQINVPLLVLHGEVDPFVPYQSAIHLVRKTTEAELVTFQEGGHLSFLIHQNLSRKKILEFVGL